MFLNLVQIAESFGVAESLVEGWVRDEGMPYTSDRGRLLFDRAQVAQWAANRGLSSQAGFLAPERSVFAMGIRLEPLLRAGGIWRNVAAAAVGDIYDRIVSELPKTTPAVRQLLAQRLRAEGGVTAAPIGGGFAVPHPSARVALGRDAGTVALLFLREGMLLGEPPADGVAVTRLFFFIAPSPRAHLDLLGRLGRLLSRGPVRDLLTEGATDEEIFRAVAGVDAELAASAARAGGA